MPVETTLLMPTSAKQLLRDDDSLLRQVFFNVLRHHHPNTANKVDVIYALSQAWCKSKEDGDFDLLEKYLNNLKPEECILVSYSAPYPHQNVLQPSAVLCQLQPQAPASLIAAAADHCSPVQGWSGQAYPRLFMHDRTLLSRPCGLNQLHISCPVATVVNVHVPTSSPHQTCTYLFSTSIYLCWAITLSC